MKRIEFYLILFSLLLISGHAQTINSVSADTSRQDSLLNRYANFLKIFGDTGNVDEMTMRARLQLWLWEHEDNLSPGTLQLRLSNNQQSSALLNITKSLKPDSLSKIEEFDFRDNTHHELQRAARLRDEIQFKDPNTIRAKLAVPLSFDFASRNCTNKLDEDDYPILDSTEIAMINILWQKPDISATDWYRYYHRHFSSQSMTFSGFEQRTNILVDQKVVCKRKYGVSKRRYSATISPDGLMLKVKEALLASDAVLNYSRHQGLLQMRNQLEDILYGDPLLLDDKKSNVK
ncbi:MAG: hypothetical protein GWN16_08745, partial [Calditrichae bacterium]|nr:hypothetical protein [Calditrichia bacterium]